MSQTGNPKESAAEQHLRLLADCATDYAFITFDSNNLVTTWSRGAEKILGFSESEAIGMPGKIFFTPEDRERGEPERETEAARTRGRAEDERWHQRKDGSRFWASGVLTPLREDETLIGYAKVMRDLTGRREWEQKLTASEAKYRALFNSMDEGYLLADLVSERDDRKDAVCVEANEAAKKMLRCDPSGQSLSAIWWGDDREWIRSVERVAASGDPVRLERYSKPLQAWIGFYAFRPDHAITFRIAILFQDVSSRKSADEAIRTSEREFRTLANLVPDLLCRSDATGYTHWYNHRWVEYTGQDLEKSLGFGWLDFIHPDDRDRAKEQWLTAIRTCSDLRMQVRLCRHDGVYRWFLMQAQPLRDDAGRVLHWFGAATDIHEQQMTLDAHEYELDRTKGELRTLATQIVTAEEDERRRISQELHDSIAQKLAVVEMGVSNLTAEQLPGEFKERLSQIRGHVENVSAEVRHLSHRLHPSVLDDLGLTPALQSLIDEFEKAHDVAIQADLERVPRNLSISVATALYRIAQEALQNAVKHAGGGPVVLTVNRDSEGLRLVVQDEGPGFDPTSLQMKQGLGLISMQERARGIHGKLKVSSVPGQGARVEVTVPWTEHRE